MRISSSRHNGNTAFNQGFGQNTGIADNHIRIGFEFWSQCFAEGNSFPIAFNEIWADMASFEAHCQRQEISDFFATYCQAEDGLAEDWNVCIYTDEPEDFDAPQL